MLVIRRFIHRTCKLLKCELYSLSFWKCPFSPFPDQNKETAKNIQHIHNHIHIYTLLRKTNFHKYFPLENKEFHCMHAQAHRYCCLLCQTWMTITIHKVYVSIYPILLPFFFSPCWMNNKTKTSKYLFLKLEISESH